MVWRFKIFHQMYNYVYALENLVDVFRKSVKNMSAVEQERFYE